MSDSYIGFKRLSSPIHFHTAVLEQTPKLVLKPLFGSGKIEEIHEETLKIRDE